MLSIVLLALASVVGGVLLLKRRQCHHRFGVPMRGTVCCMKCTRRFAIEDTADGTWRISRTPLPEPMAGSERSSQSPLS
jgi:hypothetical protein